MSPNPWEAGDFSRIAPSSIVVGEMLCDEIPVYANQRVLDIGCGSGNTAMSAARRRAEVSAVDPVAKLLAVAQQRAAVDNLEIRWFEGSAESLPFNDAAFDLALSTFGMIFSNDPVKAVSEAARVLTPEGRLVLTSWAEGGLIDHLFLATQTVLPEMAMIPVARSWGRVGDARKLLALEFPNVRVIDRTVFVRATDSERWLAGMKTFLAPAVLAYQSLSPEGTAELDRRLLALGDAFPKAPNGTLFIRVPYLEIHCSKGD
jgi:ubiquinone/menaquinone biosynthesis C-methylase UbiE